MKSKTLINAIIAITIYFGFSNCLLSQSFVLPTDDAYVRGGSGANLNFGSDAILQMSIDLSGSSGDRQTYIKFDISSLPNNNDLVYLSFYRTLAISRDIALYLTSNTWDENT